MSKSNFLETVLLNHVLRNIPYTPPATVYLALFTTIPAEDGTGGVEVSGGSYARQSVAFNPPVLNQVVNAGDVTFPTATAAWGTITSFALMDAASGGNYLYIANLTAPRTVGISDVIKFPAGQLIASED